MAGGNLIHTSVVKTVVLALGVIACAGLLQTKPAGALEFGDGELQGNLDITISHGITYRVGKPDPALRNKLEQQ